MTTAHQPKAQQRHASHFALKPLPYSYDALAPILDAETLGLHHDKHLQTYVDNLNKEVEKSAELSSISLDDIIKNISRFPESVRNNGGGVWNHDFYFASMIAPSKSGSPYGDLASAIDKSFGSLDDFKKKFEEAGAKRFGSGYAWLIKGAKGLEVISTPNQDNPLMDIAETKGTPLLCNDVWEHAYYLTYHNRRPDYLSKWWQIVNWDEVSKRFSNVKPS